MSDQERRIVWESILDNRYRCVVTQTGDWTGRLTVTDTETGEELLAEEVGLSYRALFGPDTADVRRWQDRAVEVVDSAK